MMRHDILRTVFIYEQAQRPLQVVVKERSVGFHYDDIRSLSRKKQENHLTNFKREDREKSFNLSSDVLMRISVFRTGEKSFHVVWSHHHILMDGWSVGILYGEFIRVYHSLKNGREPDLSPPAPYSDFIKWLEKRDLQKTGDFWKQYLTGYEQPVTVPGYHPIGEPPPGKGVNRYLFYLDEERTAGLNQMALTAGVTINTAVQCLWGVLISR